MADAKQDSSLHLPRILCLHGGGVNAEVFRMQARAVIRALQGRFRLVFADGPFLCEPGPGIVPVYEDCGPFRRWLRWLPEHKEVDADVAMDEIWWQINDCMSADDGAGATGEWIGLFGFSQGAKLSASLLYEQQYRNRMKSLGKNTKEDDAKPNFRFAMLLAGRAPIVSLRPETDGIPAIVSAAAISESLVGMHVDSDEHVLKLPTIHVHGLQDTGLPLHQWLLKEYCDPANVTLVEWDGAHRVPFKAADVQKITSALFQVLKSIGLNV